MYSGNFQADLYREMDEARQGPVRCDLCGWEFHSNDLKEVLRVDTERDWKLVCTDCEADMEQERKEYEALFESE